nr:MAG TPA: hypothetical protein [Caudoviricetes sp.]
MGVATVEKTAPSLAGQKVSLFSRTGRKEQRWQVSFLI